MAATARSCPTPPRWRKRWRPRGATEAFGRALAGRRGCAELRGWSDGYGAPLDGDFVRELKLPRGRLELETADGDVGAAASSWREIQGGVTAPNGFTAATTYSNLRSSKDRPDLTLVASEAPCAAAGTFTKNVVCAAPVAYCKEALAKTGGLARAILVNAGQANAATGEAGWDDAVACAERAAELLRVAPEDVLLMSTGVIGERIPMAMMMQGLNEFADRRQHRRGQEAGMLSAAAITTTDLAYKEVAIELELSCGSTVRIGGQAKGSGMIHPNMATMLGLITTDASVDPHVWRAIVRAAVEGSFNQISVDGDTSTNDTVIALANGMAGTSVDPIVDPSSADALLLTHACTAVCQALAKSIAWDGEGATCLIEVHVEGARTDADCNVCARSVASSSLVKSAVFGRDPNWGRIACAAGYSGIDFDQSRLDVFLGDHVLMIDGQPQAFDRDAASAYLRAEGERHGKVRIKLVVGDGPGYGIAWGCDLSYDYVKINAEYTT